MRLRTNLSILWAAADGGNWAGFPSCMRVPTAAEGIVDLLKRCEKKKEREWWKQIDSQNMKKSKVTPTSPEEKISGVLKKVNEHACGSKDSCTWETICNARKINQIQTSEKKKNLIAPHSLVARLARERAFRVHSCKSRVNHRRSRCNSWH